MTRDDPVYMINVQGEHIALRAGDWYWEGGTAYKEGHEYVIPVTLHLSCPPRRMGRVAATQRAHNPFRRVRLPPPPVADVLRWRTATRESA